MFKKVLVANRGEIAVRVMRACHELGIACVAVYSEADRHALHVRLADEAVAIGPPAAAQSYLSIPRLVEAARQSGAQAVHPGYGFLSENEAFAQAVLDAGLVFVGPSPQAIHALGNKASARRLVQGKVPVVPGYDGPDDPRSLAEAAGQIGYPLLVKAAAGGGGKGMRVVAAPAELVESFDAARSEAQAAFGDAHLLLEKYIPNAHHVEFQVLGDQHGKLLHLFERECSIQRRHQKIIEETPSPLLDTDLRQRMSQAAITAAQSAGYTNAGTVEFIVDPITRQFYFLEMNTRLQVEHPITELTTGLDLVQWQLRIAAGEPLPFEQAQLSQRGHAVQCRLYAEDPSNDFLPSSGQLLRFIEPQGPGIRCDSGYTSGEEITMYYDPLLAKLVVLAEDRPAAIGKMQAALRSTAVLGIPTNWQFLQEILAHPDFQAGQAYTTWVEAVFHDWRPPQCSLPPEVLIAAALTQFQAEPAAVSGIAPTGSDPYNPWQVSNGFRLGE